MNRLPKHPEGLDAAVVSTAELDMRLRRVSARTWTQQLFDWYYGYDYFISYRSEDGRIYAIALAEQLQELGFDCFLDVEDYAKGDNWRHIGRRALKKTSRLILIASPKAHQSGPVREELEAFTVQGKRVIPINFDGSLFGPENAQSPLLPFLDPEAIWIDESLQQLSLGPSEGVVTNLQRSFDLERQADKRAAVIRKVSATLLLLTLAATIATIIAFRNWRNAVAKNRDLEISQAHALRVQGELYERISPEPERGEGRRYSAATVDSIRNEALPAGYSAASDLAQTGLLLTTEALRRLDELGAVNYQADFSVRQFFDLLPPVERICDLERGPSAIVEIGDGSQLGLAVGKQVRIVNRVGGGLVRSLTHPQRVLTMAVSPDGRLLATGSADRYLRVWRVPTGELEVAPLELRISEPDPADANDEMAPLYGEGEVNLVHFSPDGHWLAAAHGSSDNASTSEVHVWDVRMRVMKVFDAKDRVTTMAISPDSRVLAVGTDGASVTAWDMTTGEQVFRGVHQRKQGDASGVHSVSFNSDATRLASAGGDGFVRVWSLREGKEFVGLQHAAPVLHVDFSDGRDDQLSSACIDKTASTWWFPGYRAPSAERLPHEDFVDWVAHTKVLGERLLMTRTNTPILRAWSLDGNRELLRRHASAAHIISRDGRTVFVSDANNRLLALNLADGNSWRALSFPNHADSLLLDLENNVVLAWTSDPKTSSANASSVQGTDAVVEKGGQERLSASIGLFNADTGALYHEVSLVRLQVSDRPDERLIGRIWVQQRYRWIRSGERGLTQLTLTPAPSDDTRYPVAMSHDASKIAQPLEKHSIGIWSGANGKLINRYPYPEPRSGFPHLVSPLSLCFNRAGSRLALADCSPEIKVWDVASPSTPRILRDEDQDEFERIQFSLSPTCLLAYSNRGKVLVFDEQYRVVLRESHSLCGPYRAPREDELQISTNGHVVHFHQESDDANVWLRVQAPPFRAPLFEADLGNCKVRQAIFDNQAKQLAVVIGNDDEQPALVRVWRLSDGIEFARIPLRKRARVEFSRDGRWLMTLVAGVIRWYPLTPRDLIADARRRVAVSDDRR